MSIFDLSALKSNIEQTSKPEENKQTQTNENSTQLNSSTELEKETKKDLRLEVALAGPLSHIYTQALNLVYAKENAIEFNVFNKEVKHEHKDVFVYCCDGSELDNETLTDANSKLRIALSEGYKKVIVAAEMDNSKKVNSTLTLLLESLDESKVKVYFFRKNALEAVKIAIEDIK